MIQFLIPDFFINDIIEIQFFVYAHFESLSMQILCLLSRYNACFLDGFEFFLFVFLIIIFSILFSLHQTISYNIYSSQQFEMNDVSQQQINCVFETDQEVPIFDQDNWSPQQQSKKVSSNKQLSLDESVQKCDQDLLNKIDKQIQNSKENFFRVNIVKKQGGKKNTQIESKTKNISLKKIDINVFEKNPNCILKQGYMEKKTDSLLFKWKTRFFALTSEKLYFFEDRKKEKVVGCVNLKLMPAQLKNEDNNIVLDFLGETQNIILKCQSKKETEEWTSLLDQVLKYQSKQKKLFLKTMIKPLYDGQDSITEKQLNKFAETGDILLFYTRNTGAKIQRILTNSDFDHVAMLVKFRHNQTMVFQSNQAHGVSIFDWNQYIRYFNLYDKVTLRKLHSPRKQEMHHTLLSFVKKNLGRKYDINALKLLKFESDFDWEKVDKQNTRGFFCSELIAKAFKSIGVIDPRKSSGRYWPVDFSEKGEIQFKNGAFLGTQQSVILNRHIKNIL